MKRNVRDSLWTLLRLRRQREDRARQALAGVVIDVVAMRRRVGALRATLRQYNAAVRAAVFGRDDGQTMPACRHSVVTAREELRRQVDALGDAQDLLAPLQRELTEAVKARRALETLERKRVAQVAADRERREQKELDDSHAAYAAVGRAWRMLGRAHAGQ